MTLGLVIAFLVEGSRVTRWLRTETTLAETDQGKKKLRGDKIFVTYN
jgi:Na+/glutamate symporter